MTEVSVETLSERPELLDHLLTAQQSVVVIRNALPMEIVEAGVTGLSAAENNGLWRFPNKGMTGGEIRTIGAAATPTFTAFRGPEPGAYEESARGQAARVAQIFGSRHPTPWIESVFSTMLNSPNVSPPQFGKDSQWLPYNLRALDPGEQIYAHHDNHYGLAIYDALDQRFDRRHLLSWFVTLQAPESGGELVIYGLWGSDPNPPLLPSRFLDIEVLERDYRRCAVTMAPGDMVIFDSGRHVHRVTPVGGQRARYTLGGFLTVDHHRTELAYWS
ncbi:MAG: 2OG-Fe(II) oxygenase [Myxococcota bacterium]|nr:2OG-Fe(II) oxygenase [Myxococcota bacterium]